ncbi:ankyrin repeat domain-containing protein [Chryseobacterium sp. JV274]|uniref:ankyrin repeat domain-containing protein n=1 Tax=Chryseobacterium sp. JV274 TaxID=1932669 RepID=UPI0021CD3552|nr:ankyrin repeat domain-containing protein [Chryseobacterium sp. JV274]
MLTVYHNHYKAARWMLENGAHPDLQDQSGNTALMGAAFKGYKEMVSLLISFKADMNAKNYNDATALIYAAVFGRTEILKILLEKGADKNIKDNRGNTALQHALMQNNEEAVKLLQGESVIK